MNTNEDENMLPFLPANGKENPFTVPDTYFSSLQNSIEAAVFVDNLKQTISTDGFSVPGGYFESLREKINSRIAIPVEKKSDNIRWITTRWSKYAAAACFALVASAVILVNQKPRSPEADLHSISEEEIVNYLKVNTEPDDSDLLINNINMDKSFTNFDKGFSDKELEQYINSTTL